MEKGGVALLGLSHYDEGWGSTSRVISLWRRVGGTSALSPQQQISLLEDEAKILKIWVGILENADIM